MSNSIPPPNGKYYSGYSNFLFTQKRIITIDSNIFKFKTEEEENACFLTFFYYYDFYSLFSWFLCLYHC